MQGKSSNKDAMKKAYNPQNLVALHNKLLSSCQNQKYSPWDYDFRARLLVEAGVNELMTGSGGVTPHQRVEILNDYGFYLFKAEEYPASIGILKEVLLLSPQRTVGWLNLGDDYRAMISNPTRQDGRSNFPYGNTWSEKVGATRMAISAYQKYLKLASHPDQSVINFLQLNVLTAPSANVCEYVAAYANAGRESEIYGDPFPVDLLGDGVKYYVYSASQGTGHYPNIFATTTPVDNPYFYGGDSAVDFSPLDSQGESLENYLLFPFKGKYYVVDDEPVLLKSDYGPVYAPVQIIAPNQGQICSISQSYKFSLSADEDHRICDPFLHGHVFTKVDESGDTEVVASSTQDSPNNIPLGQIKNDNIAEMAGFHTDGDVDLMSVFSADLLNNGKPVMMDSFSIASGAGPGCDAFGVGLYDPSKQDVLRSALSTAILKTEASTVNCDGAKSFLINIKGKTYLETDRSEHPLDIPGEAIYEVKNNTLETVCRIDMHIISKANE